MYVGVLTRALLPLQAGYAIGERLSGVAEPPSGVAYSNRGTEDLPCKYDPRVDAATGTAAGKMPAKP